MKNKPFNSQLTRRNFIKRGMLAAGAAGLTSACGISPLSTLLANENKRPPNVLFICIDDQEKHEIECYNGKGKVLTPNMNRIAKEGIRFTNGYSTSPVCTPTRYTCLTGQHASRSQHPDTLKAVPPGELFEIRWNTYLEPETCIAQAFKNSGYTTGMVGKWHVSHHGNYTNYRGGSLDPKLMKFRPVSSKATPADEKTSQDMAYNQKRLCDYVKSCGFDYAASVYWLNISDNGTPGCPQHNQEWVTKAGLDFIEANKDKPFFLYWATTLLHSPYKESLDKNPRFTPGGLLDKAPEVQPPRESIEPRLKKAGLNLGLNNIKHVTWLDDAVGALLDKLDELDIAEDTLVIYFADQQRSGKGACYEEGASTPFMMRWKGKVKPGQVSDALVSNLDIVPTVLDITNRKKLQNVKYEGKSLLPLITGQTEKVNDEIFMELGFERAVRFGKYKYIAVRFPEKMAKRIKQGKLKAYHMRYATLQKRSAKRHPAYFDRDQLYDLEKDPKEKKNLAGDPKYAEVLDDMKKRLGKWLNTFPNRPYGEFTEKPGAKS